ncbi:collagen binding domain-containing protein [Levilactobacillus namurensis]|uniref:collagen binding domain-containing protein n=1 Tax=Levilactobacillus namurensis TaxID=380393 RepID=UPI002231AB23|nr:collagen binding domain-containing protein [Levilactobacillus namurensis]MCW3779352.1 Ig-like domain-containing protein [Levilactobacillus namurensis]MDT7017764.1 collagen binding domain-containing protein [Levilactobacillus namurensis]WNN65234.1 collagen binding domain-containing protein [Levilactobacillus namurensis]
MSKKYKVVQWLLLLVATVVVVFWGQAQLTAQAATIDGSQYLTTAKVTNGPDFKVSDTVNIQYHLEFGDLALHNQDVISVPLPDNLKSSRDDTFNVTAPDGTVIGVGKVTKGGDKVEVTLNEKVEGLKDKEMTLNLATKYNGTATGEQPVNFPNDHHDVINIVPDLANISKKGTIQEDTNQVKWTVLVNRQPIEMKNLTVKDKIGDNQTMIPGLTITEAHWRDDVVGGTYVRETTPLVEGQDYTVTYTSDGFTVKFNDTVTEMYAIDYYTSIDDPSVVQDGYVFRNKADLTWGAGTNGGTNKESANGKVSTSSKNTGSGNGNAGGTDVDENGGNEGGDNGSVEPGDNVDVDGDGKPDTGTTDIDGGNETAQEEKDREAEEQETANKEAASKQPTATTKPSSKPANTQKAANAHVVGVSQAHRRAAQGKLPQTSDAKTQTAVYGLVLLTGTLIAGILRRQL